MSRSIVLAPGELYHIYNRGTDKRRIFMDSTDYLRFLALMFFCNAYEIVRIEDIASANRSLISIFPEFDRGDTLVDLCVYCLMPNHFHMLVREKEEGGISKFMQKLSTGYTMYFNTRHERSGSLLQGRFKAQHVNRDRYLKYLISYIHLNPVKLIDPKWKENGIRDRQRAEMQLKSYRYSSYSDYAIGFRQERRIINDLALREYYDTSAPSDFSSSVREWLEYADAASGSERE